MRHKNVDIAVVWSPPIKTGTSPIEMTFVETKYARSSSLVSPFVFTLCTLTDFLLLNSFVNSSGALFEPPVLAPLSNGTWTICIPNELTFTTIHAKNPTCEFHLCVSFIKFIPRSF